MKKIILTLLFFACWCGVAFGAGSKFVVTSDEIVKNWGAGGIVNMRVLTCDFTGDSATGAIPNLVLSGQTWTDGTLSGELTTPIEGWFGLNVEIDANHAGTEPTENSELYIYQKSLDLLGGNGVDQVDNTAEREVLFYFSTVALTRPIYDDVAITVTQEAAATASATGTIRIILIP